MIIPSYVLQCDGCKVTFMVNAQGVSYHPGPVKRREIRKIARQHAWKYLRGSDLCPDCFLY